MSEKIHCLGGHGSRGVVSGIFKPVLNLHVDVDSGAGIHDVGQGRDMPWEFGQTLLADIPHARDGRVMVDHQGPVFRPPHVELHAVNTGGLGLHEGGDRVFDLGGVQSAVGVDLCHRVNLD